jgi:general secretion pathway protein I
MSFLRTANPFGNSRDSLPLPVVRERAGVRVISKVEGCSTFQITLTPTLSRSTGRGGKARRPIAHSLRRGGFTLVEVLAATLLIAIVLPSVMEGVSVAARAATSARYRNEATTLAQEKLAELVVTGAAQSGNLSGDFSPDWPRYQWTATVQAWAGDLTGAGLQQIDLRVSWQDRNRQDSITLTTITYPNQTQSSTSTQ